MKKAIVLLSCIIALVSCTKEIQPSESSESAVTRFVGSAISTKITVGDKEGNIYPALWAEGDVLSIVGQDGTALGTATLETGAGEHVGIFTTTDAIADDTVIKLVYGNADVTADQVQAAPGGRDLKDITYASSEEIAYKAGTEMEFTLTHTRAIVKVTVSSSAFEGLTLKSVMLYSKGNTLAKDSDYVEVSFKTPATLSSAQEAWFTALPVENKDFYAIATMYGTYNGTSGTTVTIPVKFEGKSLVAGKVNAISLENLTLASNTESSWYEPVETRYFGQEGWAYGDANTHYAKVPGTTVDMKTELKISVKARGRFNKVEKPLTAKTIFNQCTVGRNMTRVNGSGGNLYTIADCSQVPVTAYVADSGNFGGLGQWAIYGEDGTTILWTFNLWVGKMIPEEVTLNNGIVQDRNLGAQTSIKEHNDWKSNGAYFQWGRFTFNGWGADYNKVVSAGARSIKESIQHAPKEILNPQSVEGMTNNDWFIGTRRDDLWAEQTTGAKSVYDPCPKGYKLINKAIVDELTAAIKAKTATIVDCYKDDTAAINYIEYMGSCWNLAGGFNTNLSKKTIDRAGNNNQRNAWYWTSSVKNTQGYCLYYDHSNYSKYLSGETGFQADRPRCCSYCVRCMKDTENR